MRYLVQVLLIAYGLALIIGGVMGYAKGGSLPSVVAGSISGVLVILCFGVAFKRPRLAFCLGALISIAVAGLMFWRYFETKKMMPSGGVAILSTLMAVLLIVAALPRRRPAKR